MNKNLVFSTTTAIILICQWVSAQTGQPPVSSPLFPDGALPLAEKIYEIEEKLTSIHIPDAEFIETKLNDSLKFLEQLSVTNDPKGVGIKINLPDELQHYGDTLISLGFTKLPLGKAISMIARNAELQYRITGNGVVLAELDLFTHQYIVPPNFLSVPFPGDPFGFGQDPFTPGGLGNHGTQRGFLGNGLAHIRITAKEVLEKAGIIFPRGSSAIYNPATSTLIVHNTPEQIEVVEAYVQSITTFIEKQIHLKTTIFFTKEPLINSNLPAGVKREPVEGFSQGFQDSEEMMNFLYGDEIKKKLEQHKQIEERRKTNGFAIIGVLTDSQFQVLINETRGKEGTQIKSLPDVMMLSGKSAVMAGEKAALGIGAALGADNHTLELNLYPRIFDNQVEFDKSNQVRASITDGQILLIGGKLNEGTYVSIGATAVIVDAAGRPISKAEVQ